MMPRVQEAYAKIASAASTALAGSNERYNVNHGIPGYAVGTEDAAPGFASLVSMARSWSTSTAGNLF